jgi:hypothetical protein
VVSGNVWTAIAGRQILDESDRETGLRTSGRAIGVSVYGRAYRLIKFVRFRSLLHFSCGLIGGRVVWTVCFGLRFRKLTNVGSHDSRDT